MTMTADDSELAKIRRLGNSFEATITRSFDHEVTTLWAMLTDSAKLPLWLAPGELALRKGGEAKLNFPESGINVDSLITAIDPPRLIEYSWSSPGQPQRPLRWEVSPAAGGARLTLTLRIPESEDIGRTCAGWDAHLDMLAAALEGVPIKFPFERFKTAREAYKAVRV
jgi:uncharacterized protein YndB with AHSA1/START domain